MKTPLFHGVIASCFWLALVSAAYSQPQPQAVQPENNPVGKAMDPSKQIRVQVEFIDVSHEQLTELMFGPKVPANDGELRKQVAQLIKDGKATVLDTLLCTTITGQKATSESVEEFIYPTEYEPPDLPNEVRLDGEEKTPESAKTTRPDLAVGPTPTAFDTRNIGSTLEVDGTCDGKEIHLNLTPEIVYHLGNRVWGEWNDQHGSVPIQMPKFYTLRIKTSLILDDGKYLLACALSPKNQEGFPDFTRKLMVFVKASIITSAP
ncbi:MAG: hypothetical protein ABIS50_25450 [Luteolibacter sp.]|uniref:hypothetical protein n=1 Tax=Luteolibacter sp. TaxID=1962973 RepID=UPI0032662FB7